MRKSVWITLMLCLLLPAALVAQGVTTGAYAGKVVDVDGNPVLGAEIIVIHAPTGTKFTTLTQNNGQFNVPAVRVGGPYTITAAYKGFKTEKKDGLVVKLGETKYVNFTLHLATVDAGEVVVTATDHVINPYRTGASQNVVQESIESLPTIARSLSDFTRMSPQIVSDDETDGAFNVGGRSSRYNNVQIDGAQNNDLFGLGGTGTPGGQAEASVISLDAVQEFQIVMAPYDVRQGMFTGGGVNIITKSGKNKVFGSLFYQARDESLVGKGPDNYDFSEFTENSMAATLGGPVIKNKLFFFANFEYSKKKVPEDYYIDGSGENYDWGHKDEVDRFISLLQGYGYDAGGYGPLANERTRTNIFGRLDWNMNQNHRLTLRHSYLKSDYENLSRSSKTSFVLGNGGIVYKNKTNNTVLQLNSTLGANIFNELMVNYQTVRDLPIYMGDPFPRIVVSIPGASLNAGSEEYRHKNQLDQDLIELTNNLTIFKGNHTLVFGTHNEFFKFYNVFVQRAFGKYEFKSLDDFENGNVYRFDRYYSLTGDENAPAEFNVFQLGLYAMDEWNVTPTLKLTLGIRADVPIMPDDPSNNPAVLASFGIPTNHNAGGNILWSPRVGFNFSPSQDLQVRGGVGIFSGRTPYVWISNQYSNTGVDLGRYRAYYPDFFVTDPFDQPVSPNPDTRGDINLITEDYRFPQVLKTNIAIDKKLPFGFTGTLEFVYTKSLKEIKYQNINIQATGETHSFDGRPLFGEPSTSGSASYGNPDYVDSNFQNVLLLSNTDEGYQFTISAQLQKEWGKGNMINAAYTYGEAKDLNGGTSSRAISNWRYNVVKGDPNEPELSWSSHDPGHRIMFAITKKFNFIKTAPTTVSLFYNGRSGRRYSTRYYNDVNGDAYQNDSIWVPQSEDQIILTKGTWEGLDQYIKDDPALEKHRGQILPRNASRDKWYNSLDVRLSQSIPVPGLKGHRLELFLNIKNFLNLLDKEQGIYRHIVFDDAPLTFKGYDEATGKPMFEFWGKTDDKDARYTINQLLSRWQMVIGARYTF